MKESLDCKLSESGSFGDTEQLCLKLDSLFASRFFDFQCFHFFIVSFFSFFF